MKDGHTQESINLFIPYLAFKKHEEVCAIKKKTKPETNAAGTYFKGPGTIKTHLPKWNGTICL
jgi:hypothetical protein